MRWATKNLLKEITQSWIKTSVMALIVLTFTYNLNFIMALMGVSTWLRILASLFAIFPGAVGLSIAITRRLPGKCTLDNLYNND